MIADPCHAPRAGFTLVEIVVVLAIIGLLVTLTAALTRDKLDEGKVIAAMSQMNSIKKAVADGFYRDFGYVPEEVHRGAWVDSRVGPNGEADTLRNQNPEYATRFLCLERDCTNEEIADLFEDWGMANITPEFQEQQKKWGGDNGRLGCAFMTKALNEMRDRSWPEDFVYPLRYMLMPDPSTGGRGWPGPYLTCNSWINATALHGTDRDQYPAIFYSDPSLFSLSGAVKKDVFFPVIATPWADDLEAAARKAEADKNPDLARELRKGRYYQILVYSSLRSWYSNIAGADTFLFDSDGQAFFYEDTMAPGAQVPETAVIISRGPDGLPGTAGDASTIGAENYWMQCANKSKTGLTVDQRECFWCLANPKDDKCKKYNVNIGDDMVLFIFGDGPIRSPLDK